MIYAIALAVHLIVAAIISYLYGRLEYDAGDESQWPLALTWPIWLPIVIAISPFLCIGKLLECAQNLGTKHRQDKSNSHG